MGPLSAVAIAFAFLMEAATDLGWWTVAAHPMGWILVIVLALVLLDAFVIGSGRWVRSYRVRGPRGAPAERA